MIHIATHIRTFTAFGKVFIKLFTDNILNITPELIIPDCFREWK